MGTGVLLPARIGVDVIRLGVPCVVSSALETSVGLSAQLALAGALPELDFACGLGTLSLLKGDVVPDDASLRPVDGYLPVLRTPPTPDPALLDTYPLADPDKAVWWRNRLARVRAVGRVVPEELDAFQVVAASCRIGELRARAG